MNEILLLIRMKSTNFGVAHYYLGKLEGSADDHFSLHSTCQVREMLITTVAPDKTQSQAIDYVVMPDDLTTEGKLLIRSAEVITQKEVEPGHRLHHLYSQALSQYNAARAGLHLPNSQPNPNIQVAPQ